MFEELTIAEYKEKYPPTGSRGRWHFIRYHAREVMHNAKVPPSCKVCGYTFYTEVCHKKSISLFLDTDKISDVNALSNLVYLCPNHHKEFDRGLIVV